MIGELYVQFAVINGIRTHRYRSGENVTRVAGDILLNVEDSLLPMRWLHSWGGGEGDGLVAFDEAYLEPGYNTMEVVTAVDVEGILGNKWDIVLRHG
jgi:hypothetical protein